MCTPIALTARSMNTGKAFVVGSLASSWTAIVFEGIRTKAYKKYQVVSVARAGGRSKKVSKVHESAESAKLY